jgi:hypothetical protein
MKHLGKRLWAHQNHDEPGEWRFWLHYRQTMAMSFEMVWGKRAKSLGPGFSIHFGDRGSETPVDAHLSLYWIAIFIGTGSRRVARFCEWIGRGHKRDISLKFHDGSMWWKLWYDDDMGYDSYHRCDSWRQPKLPPWRWGRKKYRPWMCLRDGHIDLNPLDAFWGPRLYSYNDLQTETTTVCVGEFPGDEYEVTFTLQEQTRARREGPSWARRETDEGWSAEWRTKGIPYRNHSWKGDDVLGSAQKVTAGNPEWLYEAVGSLIERIKKDRVRYNYRPPQEETA